MCIGHAWASLQHAMRASGVAAQPSQTAAFPTAAIAISINAARRRLTVSTCVGCGSPTLVSTRHATDRGDPLIRWKSSRIAGPPCTRRHECEYVGYRKWAELRLSRPQELDQESHCPCNDQVRPQNEPVTPALSAPADQHPRQGQQRQRLVELRRVHRDCRRRKTFRERHGPRNRSARHSRLRPGSTRRVRWHGQSQERRSPQRAPARSGFVDRAATPCQQPDPAAEPAEAVADMTRSRNGPERPECSTAQTSLAPARPPITPTIAASRA